MGQSDALKRDSNIYIIFFLCGTGGQSNTNLIRFETDNKYVRFQQSCLDFHTEFGTH